MGTIGETPVARTLSFAVDVVVDVTLWTAVWLVRELQVAAAADDHRRLGDRPAGTVVVEGSLATV